MTQDDRPLVAKVEERAAAIALVAEQSTPANPNPG